MHIVDFIIILLYIFLTLWAGIWFSKRASKGLDSYFLGGNSIKWYYLGLSNGSGMYDVSGTAWMIGILLLYGVKSAFFMWMWPIWNQVFVMMFLAVWIRRSKVMTGSEWILTRFEDQKAGRASHLIVAVFAVIASIGFIAYFFEGAGKFMTILLPWDLTFTINQFEILSSDQSYALLIIFLTTIYTVKGGMFSVVATEVLQYLIMVVAGIILAVYTFIIFTDTEIHTLIPEEWKNIFFTNELPNFWSGKMEKFNDLIDHQGYKMFGAFIGMTLFKGFFASIAGPTPGYDMQRILSTRNVKEAAYMSGFTNLVLFIPRYMLITAITVLGLAFIAPIMLESGSLTENDLEIILPKVIKDHIPIGVKGILLAGMLAAFMSTFSAFVNAGPAYVINDIYKKYFQPNESDKHYVNASYFASFGIVILGVVMGFYAESINSITLWITSALYGGYIAANFLKWIWWRFNGWGYFWGMFSGLLIATIQFILDQSKHRIPNGTILHELANMPAIYLFPMIFGFSLIGCLIGTFFSKPTDMKTLQYFYQTVHPWGCWKPVRESFIDMKIEKNNQFWLDMFNCLVGIIWQCSMVLLPIYLIVRDYPKFWISIIVLGITSLILKFSWLDKVRKIKEKDEINSMAG